MVCWRPAGGTGDRLRARYGSDGSVQDKSRAPEHRGCVPPQTGAPSEKNRGPVSSPWTSCDTRQLSLPGHLSQAGRCTPHTTHWLTSPGGQCQEETADTQQVRSRKHSTSELATQGQDVTAGLSDPVPHASDHCAPCLVTRDPKTGRG